MLIIYIKHYTSKVLANLAESRNNLKPSTTPAFTVVELTVAVAISLLMVGVIVSFMLGVTDQFAVNTVRGQLNVELTSATNRLENDVRYARSVLAVNDVSDAAAPSNDSQWNSGADQLVLGATARNSSNQPLSEDYTSQLDNIVYYLKDGTLYRRLLAFADANNRYSTATCASTAAGGCSTDTVILRNVDSLEFIYYDNEGNQTSDYSQVVSVKTNLSLKTNQSRQEIELSSSATFRLAILASPNETISAIPSLPGRISAGYGGVEFGYSNTVNVNGDISTLGNIEIVGSNTVTANNLYAGHLNCGPTYSLKYGTLCPASPAPITVGTQSSLTADSACAPATPVATNSGYGSSMTIANLTTSCDLPTSLPVFDKQALVGDIPPGSTTTGDIDCFSHSGQVNLQTNHKYVGDINFTSSCYGMISEPGVVYIDGELTIGWGGYIEVDPSVTEPVTIVVNDRVVIYNGRLGSSGRPKINLVTFDSVNETCSRSTSCNSLNLQDLYDSGRSVNHGMLIHHSLTRTYANFYAPFSQIRFATSPIVQVNEIYGQRVDINIGNLGQMTFTP